MSGLGPSRSPRLPVTLPSSLLTGRLSSSRRSSSLLLRRTKAERWLWASDTQRSVFLYGPYPLCASGGYGSGKTIAICRKIMWAMGEFPGNRGVIVRSVWDHLRATTMRTFFKVCPPEAYLPHGRRSDQDKELEFNNGSSLRWMHLDSDSSMEVLGGLEVNFFFLNQAEQMSEEVFDLLMGRLGRWDGAVVPDRVLRRYRAKYHEPWPWMSEITGRPMPPLFAMIDCNPDTELHWIYRRFHPESIEWQQDRLAEDGQRTLKSYRSLGYRMFHMDSSQNRFLRRDNLDAMLAKDDAFVRKYVRGLWGNPAGAIHRVSSLSIVEGSEGLVDWLVRNCTLHLTMDHGDSAPTCVIWWAVDRDGNSWAYREYYQAGKLVKDHRQRVYELSAFDRAREGVYRSKKADPSIFAPIGQRAGKRFSIAEEWADCKHLPRQTAVFWERGENDEMATRDAINAALVEDPERVHPISKTKPSPRFFIVVNGPGYSQGCTHLLTELRSQRRKRETTLDGKEVFSDERDDSIPDHAYDPARYFFGERRVLASPEMKRKLKPGTFAEVWSRSMRKKYEDGETDRDYSAEVPATLEEIPVGLTGSTGSTGLGKRQKF